MVRGYLHRRGRQRRVLRVRVLEVQPWDVVHGPRREMQVRKVQLLLRLDIVLLDRMGK